MWHSECSQKAHLPTATHTHQIFTERVLFLLFDGYFFSLSFFVRFSAIKFFSIDNWRQVKWQELIYDVDDDDDEDDRIEPKREKNWMKIKIQFNSIGERKMFWRCNCCSLTGNRLATIFNLNAEDDDSRSHNFSRSHLRVCMCVVLVLCVDSRFTRIAQNILQTDTRWYSDGIGVCVQIQLCVSVALVDRVLY